MAFRTHTRACKTAAPTGAPAAPCRQDSEGGRAGSTELIPPSFTPTRTLCSGWSHVLAHQGFSEHILRAASRRGGRQRAAQTDTAGSRGPCDTPGHPRQLTRRAQSRRSAGTCITPLRAFTFTGRTELNTSTVTVWRPDSFQHDQKHL